MGYQVGLVLLCRPRTRSLDETEALEEEGEELGDEKKGRVWV